MNVPSGLGLGLWCISHFQ